MDEWVERCVLYRTGFSALQRAENSSIQQQRRHRAQNGGFSALQRAENSSIVARSTTGTQVERFSALQRAENSSMRQTSAGLRLMATVSVLFSEPKIPQLSVDISDKKER